VNGEGRAFVDFRVHPRTQWPTMNGYVSRGCYLPSDFSACDTYRHPMESTFPHRLSSWHTSFTLDISSSNTQFSVVVCIRHFRAVFIMLYDFFMRDAHRSSRDKLAARTYVSNVSNCSLYVTVSTFLSI